MLQVTDTNDELEEANQILSFATNIVEQFQRLGQMTDLETAISLFREGLALLPAHHPIRLSASNNIATALMARFEQS